MARKYNMSLIMKRAWIIYRKNNGQLSWSDSLKKSWEIAKNGVFADDFNVVYKTYISLVNHYVHTNIFNNPVLAEEIVNDVFTKVYQNLASYDVSKGKLNTWILNIAKNCIIDYSRSKQYKKSAQVELIDGYVDETGRETYQFGADVRDGQNCMENKELGVTISEAMDCLSERDREITKLILMEGRSYEEVCNMLDMPLGTVKGTLNRCKAKLRKKLQGVY